MFRMPVSTTDVPPQFLFLIMFGMQLTQTRGRGLHEEFYFSFVLEAKDWACRHARWILATVQGRSRLQHFISGRWGKPHLWVSAYSLHAWLSAGDVMPYQYLRALFDAQAMQAHTVGRMDVKLSTQEHGARRNVCHPAFYQKSRTNNRRASCLTREMMEDLWLRTCRQDGERAAPYGGKLDLRWLPEQRGSDQRIFLQPS